MRLGAFFLAGFFRGFFAGSGPRTGVLPARRRLLRGGAAAFFLGAFFGAAFFFVAFFFVALTRAGDEDGLAQPPSGFS